MKNIILDKYRLTTDAAGAPIILRAGSSSISYQASEIEGGRSVAVEAVPATALSEHVRKELEIEATAARHLSHINIPALLDFGIEEEQLIYVSDFTEGTTADKWVKEHGPMPVDAVLRIGLQVVGALGASAFHQIVHHAISPENVLIVPGQTAEGGWPLIKVLNFVGVAPDLNVGQGLPLSPENPANFASPEQLGDGTVDFRSEIYSLGCTLAFLLTEEVPVVAPGHPIEPARWAGIPRHLAHLLGQMIAADRERRPLDPLALHHELQECLADVEKRGALGRKLGIPGPARAARLKAPAVAKRSIPWKPLAIAAAIVALASSWAVIEAKHLRNRLVADNKIGVPVGVPETPADRGPISPPDNSTRAAEMKNESPASESTQHSTRVANSAPAATPAPGPAVRTEPEGVLPPAPAVVSTAPAEVAVNNVPSVDPNENTPAPPAEGPQLSTAETAGSGEVAETGLAALPRQMESSVNEPQPLEQMVPEPPAKTEPVDRPVVAEVRKQNSKAAAEKQPSRPNRVAKALPPDEPEAGPPLRRGQVRARFVGITKDGQWVFRLPSSRTVVVDPRQ